MTLQRSQLHRAVRKYFLVTVAAFLTALIAADRPGARAAELTDQAHSLKTVPADVAFYSASLRLKEQWDIFRDSKAYRRLMEIPIVQIGKMQVMFQWQQSPQPIVARFREYFNSAEGQETLALVKEMHSEETFFYGSQEVAGLLQLVMKLNGVNRTAKLEAMASGEEVSEVMARNVIELLDEHAEQFVVPDMVMGYRITDGESATRHLDRLQDLLANVLEEQQPEIAEKLQREQIGGNEFLTLRLDGSMIPWDRLRDEAEDMSDEQFAKWQKLLNEKTMAVALGVVGEFVIMSIGDSTKPLETIGSGPSLADASAMKRLARHANERLTSIAYVSEALAKSMNSPRQTIDDLVGAAESGLQQLEVAEETRAQLIEDIRGLGEDMLKYMPEPGDLAGVTYLTARGYESYQYQTGTRPMEDSSEPLKVLEHVGGNPLMFVANRTKQSVADYELTVSWIKRIAVQVEQVAKEKVEPDDWDKYLELREKGLPLLERIDRANREHLMPALADGQQALVVDTAAASSQWFALMPKSPQQLPMLEIGLAASVSDADHLRKGIQEYFSVIQEAITVLHEVDPEDTPDIQLPKPEVRELAEEGTMYLYPLPAEWDVDSQITPNGALTDATAAVSFTPALTERLLRTKPLAIDTSLDLNRPASMVSYIEFAKFFEAVRPWIDYGGGIATGQIKMEDDEEEAEAEAEAEAEQTQEQQAAMMTAGMVLPQIHQFLDVAAAMRSAASVVYHEDGAWVTHSEVHFRDLEAEEFSRGGAEDAEKNQ